MWRRARERVVGGCAAPRHAEARRTASHRVVTRRIARLITDGLAGREEILALTFTNKAAGEMRERVARLLSGRKEGGGEDETRPSSDASGASGWNPRLPWISTFHAGCARILRRDGKAVGLDPDFTIYDGTDSLAAITAVSADLKISRDLYPPRAILAAIRGAKSRDLGPEEFQGRDFGLDAKVRQAYPLYQRDHLKANKAPTKEVTRYVHQH